MVERKRFKVVSSSKGTGSKSGQPGNPKGILKGALNKAALGAGNLIDGKSEAVVAATTGPAEIIPADIVDFIGKPSLLGTEVRADYDALFHRLAETVKPKDAIEWILIKDVADLVWESRRLRRIREGIVERETGQGLADIAEINLSCDHNWHERREIGERLVSDWNSGKPQLRQMVREFLIERGVEFSQVHAAVYHKHLGDLTKLEGLIANLGRRRDSVLREIERRRDTVARRPRDVTDAEFEVTKPGTQPVGN